MATAVDTLKIYERLRSAQLGDVAAKEIAAVFNDIIEEKLATSRDLKELEASLKLEIANVKADILKWIAGMLVAQAALVATLVKLL